ncbi:hypothetical protein EV361DRAFT_555180 [Lentinula raphanica]|uniref:Zn(2)-C6 fungal-type domain-containing protein n=1 Tax=Lentinula raphanica TaxID=153919 RepID=A0AA38P633_9AGAR|nr:hypothetical protein F5880DRAFT_1586344 [Lentinula raphanica]KAJ3837023.1 hypothetical protein F5878DRAFT_564702 [Lentinula raphanica]KAJ3966622.1 hypothetical protein EV361DRAFT_555180 [Lentinula raphanica]
MSSNLATASAGSSFAEGTAAARSGSVSVDDDPGVEDYGNAPRKRKTTRRRKVNHACLYCRRSHMTCDEGRPCQRCIKREIGHLCHDDRRPKSDSKTTDNISTTANTTPGFSTTTMYAPASTSNRPQSTMTSGSNTLSGNWPMVSQTPLGYHSETLGNEFSVLTDFLETLDDSSFFNAPVSSSLLSSGTNSITPNTYTIPMNGSSTNSSAANGATEARPVSTNTNAPEVSPSTNSEDPSNSEAEKPPDAQAPDPATILPAATKAEKFLLTAADQESGSRDERLSRVIRSKYEAGLLKPYNYVKGYARLSRWMDRNVSQESKQQILQPLSILRPKFRAVAQSLRDLDLVFIEEAFERLLLDYDRVFSAMGVPACLWRRTGEIYKGNREFSELVGINGYLLRDGKLCIYELMAEESAVNYWEKYGHVAFDSSQKAVLTSCVLRYKPQLNISPTSPRNGPAGASASGMMGAGVSGVSTSSSSGPGASLVLNPPASSNTSNTGPAIVPTEEGLVNCCFSFTIRRDKWGIPSMIVGNFIRC